MQPREIQESIELHFSRINFYLNDINREVANANKLASQSKVKNAFSLLSDRLCQLTAAWLILNDEAKEKKYKRGQEFKELGILVKASLSKIANAAMAIAKENNSKENSLAILFFDKCYEVCTPALTEKDANRRDEIVKDAVELEKKYQQKTKDLHKQKRELEIKSKALAAQKQQSLNQEAKARGNLKSAVEQLYTPQVVPSSPASSAAASNNHTPLLAANQRLMAPAPQSPVAKKEEDNKKKPDNDNNGGGCCTIQ